MKVNKRILLLFLSLIAVLAVFRINCVSVKAIQNGDVIEDNGIHYLVKNSGGRGGDLTLIGYIDGSTGVSKYTGDVKIPREVVRDGYDYWVSAIDKNAFDGSSITSVTIDCGGNDSLIESIGDEAFSMCSKLKSVKIVNGSMKYVKDISPKTFAFDDALVSVDIPGVVTIIKDNAFEGCTALKSVNIPSTVTSLGNSVFNGCASLTEVNIPDSVTQVGNNAFEGCTNLKKVTIGSGVKTIGSNAFLSSGLTEVNIPDMVTSIGNNTFNNCSGLKKVTIGSGVKTISDSMFQSSGLTEVNIPDTVTGIGNNAFNSCSGLKKVTIGSGVKTIGDSAFQSTGLTEISIPDAVTGIGNYIFSNSSLKKVIIGSGVKTIGNNAFDSCGLTEIDIPDTVTSIGSYAFNSCVNLKKVNIGSGIKTISKNMFSGSGIETIIIPDTVTAIDNDAFDDCKKLQMVDIGSGVQTINDYVFNFCQSLKGIIIPANVNKIGQEVFIRCWALHHIIVQSSSVVIGSSALNTDGYSVIYGHKDSTVQQYASKNKANFQAMDYIVWYDGNGSTGGDVPDDIFTGYLSGTSITVAGNTKNLAKTGYGFLGWNTQKDGSGTSYKAGSTLIVNSDITLYAQWGTPVSTMKISSENNMVSVAEGSTLKFNAKVEPDNAADKTVTWSIMSGSEYADIDSVTGILTAKNAGKVTVKATANDGSGVNSTIKITVTEPDSGADIKSFKVPSQLYNPIIDNKNHKVTFFIPANTDVKSLKPEIVVSDGASISPASGEPQDFTKPIIYAVTSKNNNKTEWTVCCEFGQGPQGDKLIGITQPPAATGIANGTAKTAKALGLPPTVQIKTSTLYMDANVIWHVGESTYDPGNREAQTFTISGDVELPDGVTNNDNISLKVSISVTVDKYINIPVNHAPAVVPGKGSVQGSAAPASSDGKTTAVPFTMNMAASFTDEDKDSLTYAVVSAVDSGNSDVSSRVSINGSTLLYTPSADDGNKTVTMAVKANDGKAESTGNLTITVAVGAVPADTPDQKVVQPQITTDPVDVSALPNDKVVHVTIGTQTTGSAIYYTIDGSTPTESSKVYDSPFDVQANSTTGQAIAIKAIAIKSGMTDSEVAEKTINFSAAQPSPVLVAGVSLNKTTLDLTVGKTETLTAAITPDDATNKSLKWVSSDPNAASVDGNGKVTAIAAGTANITATAADGSGKTASCTVAVSSGNGGGDNHGGGSSGGGITPAPTQPSNTVSGEVVDSRTGQEVKSIVAKVFNEANDAKTVEIKSSDLIMLKQPDGTQSTLSDTAKLGIKAEDAGSNVTLSSDGTIRVKNLSKGTELKADITYDLGNGQKVTIGKIDIKVDNNGKVSLTYELIDPYGVITDSSTGKPVEGAEVTLYYANTGRNKTSGKTPDTAVKLPSIDGFKPNNNKNPQISDTAGAYGFMVFPDTDYYIVARKNGYEDYRSPIISVEKEIVKWDFKMNKSLTGVNRLSGQSRVDTAIEIAKAGYTGKVKNLVLATADNYPDALSGSVFAYKNSAPILLIGNTDSEQQKVIEYMKNNMESDGTVYILGGTGAVGSSFEEKVASSGFKNITRLGGANMYETSVKIAESLGLKEGTSVVLVNGDSYPDALSISSEAATMGMPILLVEKDRINGAVKSEIAKIKPSKIYAIGLEGVISDKVLKEAASIAKSTAVRIGGKDRYKTSIEAAKYFNTSCHGVCIATGNNYPDALAGSVYAAGHNVPVILADDSLSDDAVNYLKPKKISGSTIFGGESVISKKIEEQLSRLIENKQ